MKKESKSRQKLGFSLIELSVVILVIGILVIGITQGSRIINQSRLKSAQSLTQSSPVGSTAGLMLWLETTSEKSLDSSISDNNLVTNWYDINPQNSSPINGTQLLDNNKPTYLKNGINSFPSLRFFGNPASSAFPNVDFFNLGDVDLSQGGQLTIFAVASASSTPAASNYIIGHGNGWTRWRLGIVGFQSNKGNISGSVWAINTPNVYSAIIYDSSVKLRLDGTQIASGALTAGSFTQDNALMIGATELGTVGAFSLDGMLGEIIVFNRALKDQEIISIETYLKQKWRIN